MIEIETIEATINLDKIDKSNWQTYRFDEIAFNISERIDPKETDLEIYVGLEHLEPESIQINRWGTPSDVEGIKLKVYPGDIIFGKRRAYQRKAALATFEGICSAHAMVLRPNSEIIDPSLFPFFLHSDSFMHKAVNISVGSLSPTINWKTLAEQEFLLPSKEEQVKLAELLWASYKLNEKYVLLKKALQSKRNVIINNSLKKFLLNNTSIKLQNMASFTGGFAFKSSDFSSEEDGKKQVLKIANLTPYGLDLFKVPAFVKDNGYDKKYLFQRDDIIISLTGSNGKRDYGFAVINETEESYWVNQRIAIIRTNRNIVRPKFLYYLMKEDIFLDSFFKNAIGTASQANVSMKEIQNISLPIPSVLEQDIFIKEIDSIISLENRLETLINYSKTIQMSLINQIFI